jgi:serine/threonine protein kinase
MLRHNYLGSGSFGDVYRGTYKREKVAVKRIRMLAVEMDGDWNHQSTVVFLKRLQQEAEVLAGVGIHPNILQLYGFNLPGNDGGDGPIFNKQDRRPPSCTAAPTVASSNHRRHLPPPWSVG